MSQITNYLNSIIDPIQTTIASGQTESSPIDVYGTTLKTIFLPSAFDGTSITFQVSYDGTTYYDYYNVDNQAVTVTCSANRAYGWLANDFYSIRFLKLVSNATESADRIITLILGSI